MTKSLPYILIVSGGFAIIGGIALEARTVKADPWASAPTHMSVARLQALPDASRSVKRDPFSGAPVAGLAAPGIGQPGPGVPAFGEGGLPQMVPNPGGLGAAGGADAYVIGTMVGGDQRPLALVREGNQTSVLGVGDIFGGKKISKIVPQGVEFTDGSRLAVDAGPSQPVSAPAPARAPQQGIGMPIAPLQQAPQQQFTPPTAMPPPANVPTTNVSPAPDATPVRMPRLYTPQPGPTHGLSEKMR